MTCLPFKLHLALLLLMAAALLTAATYDELSDECAGQFLRQQGDNKLYCFKRLGTNDTWCCTRMEDGEEQQKLPAEMSILPLYKDSPAFDILSYSICFVMPSATPEEIPAQEAELAACREMLAYCQTSQRCQNLLECLERIDAVTTDIQALLKKFRPRTNDSGNAVIKLLQNNKALQLLTDTINDGDFQVAIACYFRYCHAVRAATAKMLLPAFTSDTETLLNKTGELLRTSYANQAAACRLRVSSFQALFPDATGPWRNSPPAIISTMETMALAANRCFLNSLEYSENADFPRWGSAMLGVFRLMPSETLEPEVMARFDKALKRYSDRYQTTP